MISYTSIVVMILYFINFWNLSLLKDTIIWFCFSGVVISINSVTSDKDYNLFKKIILDNIIFIFLYEFIVNVYTFPLWAEFFFLPFVTFIILLDTVASLNKKYTDLSKILKILQFIIGISVLIYSIYSIIHDFKNFKTLNTLKDFLLPIILSISFIPFIYISLLYSNYEHIFKRLNLGYKKDNKLKNYAKIEILKYSLFNLKKVKKILDKNVIHNLMFIENKKGVDNLIKSLK